MMGMEPLVSRLRMWTLPRKFGFHALPTFWLSFVLIGIYLGHHPFYRMAFTFRMHWLEVMGRHALIIYLTHQVVLFGLVSFVYYLLNS